MFGRAAEQLQSGSSICSEKLPCLAAKPRAAQGGHACRHYRRWDSRCIDRTVSKSERRKCFTERTRHTCAHTHTQPQALSCAGVCCENKTNGILSVRVGSTRKLTAVTLGPTPTTTAAITVVVTRVLARQGVAVTLLEKSGQLCSGATWYV